MQEIDEKVSQKEKNRKMTNNKEYSDVNYSVKSTIYRITAEQEKKFKTSKAYKNAQNTEYVQAIEEIQKESN